LIKVKRNYIILQEKVFKKRHKRKKLSVKIGF